VIKPLCAGQQEKIAVVENGKVVMILLNDVVYIQSDGNYIVLYCLNKIRHTDSSGLTNALKVLAPYGFLSIHRSWCVNKHKISSVSRTSVAKVTLVDDSVLTVSRRKKNQFLRDFLL